MAVVDGAPDRFDTAEYWEHFHSDDGTRLYDWYTVEDALAEVILAACRKVTSPDDKPAAAAAVAPEPASDSDDGDDSGDEDGDALFGDSDSDDGAVATPAASGGAGSGTASGTTAGAGSGGGAAGGAGAGAASGEAGSGTSATRFSVLDVGVGTCPLLFTLRPHPEMGRLVGVDFSPKAIDFMAAQAAERVAETGEELVEFYTADATDLSQFDDGAFDLVVDKGCLDCFLNSGAFDRVRRYLDEVVRVLAPGGTFVLVAVADMETHTLLTKGRVVSVSGEAGVGAGGARPEAGEPHVPGGALPFRVKEVRVRYRVHIALCEACTVEESAAAKPAPVVCDECDRSFDLQGLPEEGAFEESWRIRLPAKCPGCDSALHKFVTGGRG